MYTLTVYVFRCVIVIGSNRPLMFKSWLCHCWLRPTSSVCTYCCTCLRTATSITASPRDGWTRPAMLTPVALASGSPVSLVQHFSLYGCPLVLRNGGSLPRSLFASPRTAAPQILNQNEQCQSQSQQQFVDSCQPY